MASPGRSAESNLGQHDSAVDVHHKRHVRLVERGRERDARRGAEFGAQVEMRRNPKAGRPIRSD